LSAHDCSFKGLHSLRREITAFCAIMQENAAYFETFALNPPYFSPNLDSMVLYCAILSIGSEMADLGGFRPLETEADVE
jgi:hypothetical protein